MKLHYKLIFSILLLSLSIVSYSHHVYAQSSATLTPKIDGVVRSIGFTVPARIYHIRTGLNIQIEANSNLIKPIIDLSLTGMTDDPGNNSLTYILRFTHPAALLNPLIAANINTLNAQVALLDNRSVRTFTGDINPILASYNMVPAGTISTLSITAWSKLPSFGTISYALYDNTMTNLLAATGSINLEFTRPSLSLSGSNPALYEYKSLLNPNLDVIVLETGLYANLSPIQIDMTKLSVSLNSGAVMPLTGLYTALSTLGLGTYSITYYYTGADSDMISLSDTISGTYVHALPIYRTLIVQDTIPPVVTILGPVSGTIINNTTTTFTFTGSDNYTLSGIKFECKINAGSRSICASPINYSNLSNGEHTLYVRGIDSSGNTGNTMTTLIKVNYIDNNTVSGYAGGGGAPTIPSSTTDTPKKIEHKNDPISYEYKDLYNTSIENGRCYKRKNIVNIIDSKSIITTDEFKKGLTFLYAYDMTMFRSIDEFDPNRKLTREEAAKIFSNFAMNVLCRIPDKNLKIYYSDVENSDPTLKNYITLAYELGLMKGGKDGKFRPFDGITKAEFNAVLIRMILKSYLPEDGISVWHKEYNDVSSELEIIKYGAGDNAVTRSESAIMLFRAYKEQKFDFRYLDYETYVLDIRDKYIK